MLADVALLEIFESYVNEELSTRSKRMYHAWHTLVHVCRKWRNIVFGSPRRLNLRLYCRETTPVREMLDIWPPLPLMVSHCSTILSMDNTFAALEHNDRICYLNLYGFPSSHSEKVLVAMQQPFPALSSLELEFGDETVPIDPASFLGGSAPRLKYLRLGRISLPRLPKLLLTATHLAGLDLQKIPHSGYISPEAMVTCLSMLTRLQSLVLRFESPRSRPDRNNRLPPPPTRTLLPVLTMFWFTGVSEYLEDLVARIDAPLLHDFCTVFFHQLIFDTPRLTRFISRTPEFMLKAHSNKALLAFSAKGVSVSFSPTFLRELGLTVSCKRLDWQLSSLAQVCSSFPPAFIPAVEHLHITRAYLKLPWSDDIENSQLLELLHPFTGVKSLHISQKFMSCIAPILQELVGETATEVFPALQTLFLDEPLPPGPDDWEEAIEKFVAARQLAGCPIAVSRWER